jgi:hypothetical protein
MPVSAVGGDCAIGDYTAEALQHLAENVRGVLKDCDQYLAEELTRVCSSSSVVRGGSDGAKFGGPKFLSLPERAGYKIGWSSEPAANAHAEQGRRALPQKLLSC